MLRGINRQVIFEEDEDYEKMLMVIKDVKIISRYKLFAYCLMQNHCHFVLQDEKEGEGLESIFKRIGARYVYWYNLKYNRVGHLFQDRYKSEVIEDEKRLLTVVRYVHQNPLKAGLCDDLFKYEWSSYKEFVGTSSIIDTDLIFDITDKQDFIQFNMTKASDIAIEDEPRVFRQTEDMVKKEIFKICGCSNVTEFQQMEIVIQRKCIEKLKEYGASIRQLNRLTGVSRGVIERI